MDETAAKLTSGEPLSLEQLTGFLPALKEIPAVQLEKYATGAAVLQRYRKGDTVCVEGQFGATAYYIVSGTVEISIQNPLAHLRTRLAAGFFGRSVPLFASVGEEFLRYLKDKIELVSYNQNDVICKEGEDADAFYLIRSGMVRVSQAMPGGDMVRTYLSRGDFFGEIGLLRSIKRIATCSALDAVDVVKVPGAEFNLMLEKFPGVRAQLEPVADARMAATKSRVIPPGLRLDDYLNQGLFEAQNLLLIDLDNCTRCDACVQACAKAHDGISRLLRDGLRYDHFLVATACRSCRDPLCMTQCPVGSIRRKENLEIIIEDWCIGCGKCAELCPYGNINMHPIDVVKEIRTEVKSAQPGLAPKIKIEKKKTTAYKANTCDLCTQLSTPSCVYACPHDAAKRVDPRRFFSSVIEAQTMFFKTTTDSTAGRRKRHLTD